MDILSFIPKYPLQSFTEEEKTIDYSEQDHHYIRCLQAMEELMDIDAYIFDYQSEKVLELSGQGKTEPEIARALGISLATVKYHKQRIFSQLNVKNIAEAIQWMNTQKKMVQE